METFGRLCVALVESYDDAEGLIQALATSGRLPCTDVVCADMIVSRLHLCVAAHRCNVSAAASASRGGATKPGSGFVSAVAANRSMSESYKTWGFDGVAAAARRPMLVTVWATTPSQQKEEMTEALSLVRGAKLVGLQSLPTLCQPAKVAAAYALSNDDTQRATLESLAVNRVSTFDV
jgi:hypothetical protein